MTSSLHSLVILALSITNLWAERSKEFDWCALICNWARHTMCEYKAGGPAECSGAINGLNDEEKTATLSYHNELRAKVAKGEEPPQPEASDMKELLWDDELAEVAQRWIEQCQFGLGHDKCRVDRDGEPVGQNVASKASVTGFPNRPAAIKALIRLWYDEVKKFDKALVSKWGSSDWPATGHYTQMVWADTTHVGCGLYSHEKNNTHTLKLACNYKPAGNTWGKPVYNAGKTASKCPTKSVKYPELCGP